MATKPRRETDVLAELEWLARTPGYAHVLAHLCNRDNLVIYRGQIKSDDMAKLYGHNRLIRTELNTLLRLMIKVRSLPGYGSPTTAICCRFQFALSATTEHWRTTGLEQFS